MNKHLFPVPVFSRCVLPSCSYISHLEVLMTLHFLPPAPPFRPIFRHFPPFPPISTISPPFPPFPPFFRSGTRVPPDSGTSSARGFSDAGYPLWVNSRGRVISLAQFRDNILVASKGPGSSWAMVDVCNILQRAWSLRVLCPCISDSVDTCQLTCMSGQLHALGVAMNRRDGYGEVYVHPSALTPD